MTLTLINSLLLGMGLLLQGVLLVLLFVRGVARRLPVFTALLGFYLLRSALLFAVFHHVGGATYAMLYAGFSYADLALQLAVAGELLLCVPGVQGKGVWGGAARVAALCLGAAAVAWTLNRSLPAGGRMPVDRGALFVSAVLLLTYGWMVRSGGWGLARRVASGFAVYGGASLVAAGGRSYAAVHRAGGAYAGISYAQAVVYLGVVLFWIVCVRGSGEGYAAETIARSCSPVP